jgi:NADP-dependent 3-hydroxy acid dehydrogenase YdfG
MTTMTPFTVTSEDQGCSGHMDTIPAGEVAFKDTDGWVWCAGAAAQVVAEAARREAIRKMLDERYHGVIPVTDEMIDAVLDGLDEER